MQKWGLTSSSECSFCLHPESLLHVAAGCSSYLDRFTWRHDSILQFITNNLPLQHIQKIYADLPSFPNPSVITGDDHRPDRGAFHSEKSVRDFSNFKNPRIFNGFSPDFLRIFRDKNPQNFHDFSPTLEYFRSDHIKLFYNKKSYHVTDKYTPNGALNKIAQNM